LETKGLRKVVLTEEQFKEIRKSLASLRKKSNVDCIILIDESGQPISSSLKDPETPIAAISALIAGNFAAANELSKLVGESEVKSLLQEGETISIYSCRVANKFILLIIFSSNIRFGMVKLYTHQTIKQLEDILKNVTFEAVEVEKTQVEESRSYESQQEETEEQQTEQEAQEASQSSSEEQQSTSSGEEEVSEDDLDSALMLLKQELEKSLKEEDKSNEG